MVGKDLNLRPVRWTDDQIKQGQRNVNKLVWFPVAGACVVVLGSLIAFFSSHGVEGTGLIIAGFLFALPFPLLLLMGRRTVQQCSTHYTVCRDSLKIAISDNGDEPVEVDCVYWGAVSSVSIDSSGVHIGLTDGRNVHVPTEAFSNGDQHAALVSLASGGS